MALQISSRFLANGQHIPVQYTCDGENVSPPLEWTNAPAGTKSLVLICEDPDAASGTFTHWMLYDIPPTAASLSEGQAGVGRSGRNSFKHIGYSGPCPPHGVAPHRYVFHLFAIDIASIGREGLTRNEVIAALEGHVLAEGQLLARYQRATVSTQV